MTDTPKKPFIHNKDNLSFLIDPFGKAYNLPTGRAVRQAEKLIDLYHNGDNKEYTKAAMDLAFELDTREAYWYLEDTAIGIFDSVDEAIDALQEADDPVLIRSETTDGIIEHLVPKKEIRISADL